MNKYEKSLMIVVQKSSSDIFTFAGLFLYVKLFLSVSLFNACLGTSIKILGERAWGSFSQIKNQYEILYIKEIMDYIYNDYITRYPKLKIPKEYFLSMIDQMSQRQLEDSTEMFMKTLEELLDLSKETLDEIRVETMDDDLQIYER